MTETNLTNLKINVMNEAQKDQTTFDANELIMTPDDSQLTIIDDEPTEGSQNAVSSGGVYNSLKKVPTLIASVDIPESHKNVTITNVEFKKGHTYIIDFETVCSGRDALFVRPNGYQPNGVGAANYQGGICRLNDSKTSSGTASLQGYAYVGVGAGMNAGELLPSVTSFKSITIHVSKNGDIFMTSIDASTISGTQSVGIFSGYLPSTAFDNFTSLFIGLDVSSAFNLSNSSLKVYER